MFMARPRIRTRRFTWLPGVALLARAAGGAENSPAAPAESPAAPVATVAPAPAAEPFDVQAALAELRERIAGREQQPAEEVFEEIRLLRGMPAGRLLRVMEIGFAGSLGVACTHCHVAGRWASEEKPQKQIAREMCTMVGKINNELLPAIANLGGWPPAVNCTTCDRGAVKPALTLAP